MKKKECLVPSIRLSLVSIFCEKNATTQSKHNRRQSYKSQNSSNQIHTHTNKPLTPRNNMSVPSVPAAASAAAAAGEEELLDYEDEQVLAEAPAGSAGAAGDKKAGNKDVKK